MEIRTKADIEAIEQTPLGERIFSWDVNAWIERGLERAPERAAIIDVPGADPIAPPRVINHRELQRRRIQTANLLHTLGVRSEDVVVLVLPTLPELFIGLIGGLAAGAVCAINWMLRPEQLAELIAATRAKVVLVQGPTPGFEIWENFASIRHRLPADLKLLTVAGPGGSSPPESDFATLAAQHSGDELDFTRPTTPDSLAALVHSGGTTGTPKLVRLTHRGFAYKCWANTLIMDHQPGETMFADYPMFHIAGLFGRGVLPIVNSMSIVIPSPIGAREKAFLANYWKLVERYRISMLSGVPTTLAVLAKMPPTAEDLSSFKPIANTGSTAFPAEVARELQRMTGVAVLGTYGATEYTMNVSQPPKDGEPRFGSAGLRLPYTEIAIADVDDDGRIVRRCGVDEIGVVMIRGPGVTPGYLDPAQNVGKLVAEGWFNSGDLGRIDADGYLWLTGRAKDIIIRGGHNIDPSMIEETLLKHPDVLHAAAVPWPDAYAGEVPVALVQLVDGAQTSAVDLRDFAAAHVAERPAAPKEIFLLERMPLTDVGKPMKGALRLEAAHCAYVQVLADVTGLEGSMALELTEDKLSGLRLIARIAAPAAERPAMEQQLRQRLAPFAVAWSIEWRT